MSAETLLSRLDGVRATGAGRYLAKCPAHRDRSPSLSIREVGDGRTLLHCFSGCAPADVLAAVGLNMADLFPDRPLDHHIPRERAPFNAMDILRAVTFEVTVVCLVAADLLNGKTTTREGYDRLRLAADRLDEALELAGGAQ